jgi:hypothetical protein
MDRRDAPALGDPARHVHRASAPLQPADPGRWGVEAPRKSTSPTSSLARLREQTSDEDHAYFVDIAQFMADVPVDQASGVRWLDSEQHTRSRWRGLVTARQAHLHAGH